MQQRTVLRKVFSVPLKSGALRILTTKRKSMNKELLFQLYAIHSPSGGEKKMRRFIKRYIMSNCGNVSIVQDANGNLLCTKGESETYPCLASHMDQVQRNHSKDFQCLDGNDVVFGYSAKSRAQQGLGADDKNGILICLECLKKYDVLKVAFFVEEEIGCGGSGSVDLEFFKDCRFIIQPDRRGGSDLITSMFCGDVCSNDFIKSIGYVDFGYKIEHGTVTDVGELVDMGVGISCLNLSCGYYEAHTDHEFTVLSELENCLMFVEHIIETCVEVYPFEIDYGYFRQSRFTQKSHLVGNDSDYGWGNDWDYYYDGGYYDSDFQTMEEYLKAKPDLSFDEIKANYLSCFNAYHFFDGRECNDVVRDLYDSAKEYSFKDYWDDGDDDVSFPKSF